MKQLFSVFISVSILEVIAIYAFRVQLYEFFITDPNVVNLGVIYMTYFVPFFPFFTVFQLCMSVLQASGKTRITMILSLVRLWGMRILLAVVFIVFLIWGLSVFGLD